MLMGHCRLLRWPERGLRTPFRFFPGESEGPTFITAFLTSCAMVQDRY